MATWRPGGAVCRSPGGVFLPLRAEENDERTIGILENDDKRGDMGQVERFCLGNQGACPLNWPWNGVQ
jgi:hypothetical protein